MQLKLNFSVSTAFFFLYTIFRFSHQALFIYLLLDAAHSPWGVFKLCATFFERIMFKAGMPFWSFADIMVTKTLSLCCCCESVVLWVSCTSIPAADQSDREQTRLAV